MRRDSASVKGGRAEDCARREEHVERGNVDTAELLGFFSYDKGSCLYVLRSKERRVTVYSQQIRALNLIHALRTERGLGAGAKVAVIGGGVAGVTATTAALALGAEVHLFEKQPVLLPFQSGNSTRWLHPRIYDWPLAVSAELRTDLPFLNWSMGTAGDVAEEILAQFRQITRAAGEKRYKEITSCKRFNDCQPSPTGVHLFVDGKQLSYNFVILTLGFGREGEIENVKTVSYWRNEAYAQPAPPSNVSPGKARSYLITGAGDGGLIDLLRVRVQGFRQDRVVNELFGDIGSDHEVRGVRNLVEHLRGIHKELFGKKKQPDDYLEMQYQALTDVEKHPGFAVVKNRLRLRPDTSATLHGEKAIWAGPRASVLHSFLAFVLRERDGGFNYRHEELSVTPRQDQKGWKVTFKGHGFEEEQEFDEIIVRRGAAPLNPQDSVERCLLEFRRRLDGAEQNDFSRDYQRDLTGQRLEMNSNDWWLRNSVLPLPPDQESPRAPAPVPVTAPLPSPAPAVPDPPSEIFRHLDEIAAKEEMVIQIRFAKEIFHASVSAPFARQGPGGASGVSFELALIEFCKQNGLLRYIANLADPARQARIDRIRKECPGARFEWRSAPEEQPAMNYLLIDPGTPSAVLYLIVEGQARAYHYSRCTNPVLISDFRDHFLAYWTKLERQPVLPKLPTAPNPRQVLADALDSLAEEKPRTPEELQPIAERHGLDTGALMTALQVLSPFGVVNVDPGTRAFEIPPLASSFFRSFASFVRTGEELVEDWVRKGADGSASGTKLMERGVRFLAAMEARRLQKCPDANVLRKLRVSKAFIKGLSVTGKDVFLVTYRAESRIYQLPGGTLKMDETFEETLHRELLRLFPESTLVLDQDYWTTRINPEPLTERFISPTYGAYTQYDVVYYQVRFRVRPEDAPHFRWVSLDDLLAGVTDGRRIVTPPEVIRTFRKDLEAQPLAFPT